MSVFSSKAAVCPRLLNACFRRTFYLYSPEPFHPLYDRVPEYKTAEEAVQVIQSGRPNAMAGAAHLDHFLMTCIGSVFKSDKVVSSILTTNLLVLQCIRQPC